MTFFKAIHDRLMQAVLEGPYYGYAVDPETKEAILHPTPVPPAGVSVQAALSTFGRTRGGAILRTDRTSWIWEAHVEFASQNVSVEAFEDTFIGKAIPIQAPGRKHLLATLESSNYRPVPEASPSRGTLVVFTFSIVPESLRT